ncbi:MAG TPA: hypothetical protein VHX38_25885 [Pseudonocardiaceae bacterium]|jgi:hypothetical protein|nr:hypothetical protein [Pseudonocardiaceae bacterium]
MPNSTRRGFGGRADVIEVFSPRRSGPWHLLRPLHTKVGFFVLAAITLIGFIHFTMTGDTGLADTVVITAVVLFVLSFAIIWQLTGLLLRSRAELTGIAITVFTASLASGFLPLAWAYTVVLSLLTALFALPWSRRYVVGRMWCVIDRHRLRLCLRQTKVRTMNMDGSLPLMLWARPTKTGERIWMWIRAGSAAEDIGSALDYIAPACYAREARIHEVRKLTTLVAIEVIRRDPLSKPEPILSVLKKYIPVLDKNRSAEGTEAIKAATVIDITTTPVEPVAATTDRKSRKTTAPAVTAAPPVMVGGEDLSDYID